MSTDSYQIKQVIKQEIDSLSTSRYKKTDILKDSEGVEFLESWRNIKISLNENDRFHQVGPGEKNRIDIIAYNYYDNTTLWWVIALANNIDNPFELKVGEVLRIPTLNSLYGFKGVLS